MCRSIHACLQCNGISHVKLVHSCQSLRRGERLSFQGSHSQRPRDPFFALPTTRPRPRIMNSLHPLISSLICEHAKPSLASSSELGKASDACMPFVPVGMEATTLLLLPNLLTFFLSFLVVFTSFYFLVFLRLCASLPAAAPIARALRAYHTTYTSPSSRHQYHNNKSHAAISAHSLLLETFLCAQDQQRTALVTSIEKQQ